MTKYRRISNKPSNFAQFYAIPGKNSRTFRNSRKALCRGVLDRQQKGGWKTLGQLCRQKGLGNEPRRVIDELSQIRMVDVELPTRSGHKIRRRCISQPTEHQAILLHHLALSRPWNSGSKRNLFSQSYKFSVSPHTVQRQRRKGKVPRFMSK